MAGSFGAADFNPDEIYTAAMFTVRVDFETDADDGTVAEKPFAIPFGCFLADLDFVSNDTLTVEVVVKTVDGVIAHPDDTISLEAGKRYPLSGRPTLIGGFQLSLTTAGVADAGKSGTLILNLANNRL